MAIAHVCDRYKRLQRWKQRIPKDSEGPSALNPCTCGQKKNLEQEQILPQKISFHGGGDVQTLREKASSEETICELDYEEKTVVPTEMCKFLKQRSAKPKIIDFPSNLVLKLPYLSSRYHGPGCAMEISVLEKHDEKCRFKKSKNPRRDPVDDRSGSYDVIGRIMFKTCQVGNLDDNSPPERSPEKPPEKPPKKLKKQLADFYSLCNLHFPQSETFAINSSTSEKYVKHLESPISGIITSSKSFPTQLGIRTYENGKADDFWVEMKALSKRKVDKAVQITSRSDQKKWYYFLFPCLFVYSGG
ncbi:hypothetical protein JTB14_029937 [Gonioctena quinquepunctata]|nr:hypothetical protein JTB14_029937 [Gonioctena quinquepunctata]